ncbi:hypothetical protein M433DRAFT_144007 [Acidomyces richmondensis BFW]|nr:MAG: hypothetical protein FE78DRAFT_80132 [Acidomyces sp. 'richmondensis']KYG45386.1 hypothetical protein M433DRAFT_144007 [Acidomyces richmondensis BFW]
MATLAIPPGGIKLHGFGENRAEQKAGTASALLLRLDKALLQEFRAASHAKDSLQLLTGSTPKLRIGGRTIDLKLSPEAFRHELYLSTVAGSLANVNFSAVISHCADIKGTDRGVDVDTAGSDAALAALQNSLASFEQEKQAKQSNIVRSILPTPKNRFDAARKQKRSLLDAGSFKSPTVSAPTTPRLDPAPTSDPLKDAQARLRALKIPVIHFLALRPATTERIIAATNIPKADLESILAKIARQEDGKWKLVERAYKDLDIWNFNYSSSDDRDLAVRNAIGAFDRLRIGKDEKIWQQLLREEDRGKGIILSRLGAGQAYRSFTSNHAASPLQHGERMEEGKILSATNTPHLGASTPRPGSSKGDVMKRLLSKDPKKRTAEAAKEKKRREREAAASDREVVRAAKRQRTKTANPKVKSAEIVHSSDDESGEEGEVKEGEIKRVDSKTSPEKPKLVGNLSKASSASSPDSSDGLSKSKLPAGKPKMRGTPDPAKSIASLASKAAKSTVAGKTTPHTANGLSAPSSQQKPQRSPSKAADSKPNVPSPLGAARPRVASDVSDRPAVAIQRKKQDPGTLRGLGITNGVRKREDTVTSTASSGSDRKQREESVTARKTAALNEISSLPTHRANGIASKSGAAGVKRKAESISSTTCTTTTTKPQDNGGAGLVPKNCRTESISSQSQKSQRISTATAQTSPDTITFDSSTGSGSDSAASVLDTITYTQGVNLAEKFRDVYYPAYAQMYDSQAAKRAKGEEVSKAESERLWAMHRRLEQMKREIQAAALREH